MIVLRAARPEEARDLAKLSCAATHGLLDVFYRDLISGQSLIDTIVSRRILREGHLASLPFWSVAAIEGRLAGAINAFAFDDVDATTPDPLLTPDRTRVAENLTELEARAAGSYYINAIATLPQFQGHGVGRSLVQHAIEEAARFGLNRVTLSTFEEDERLIRWYERQGFEVKQRAPVIPHPLFHHTGNWVFMELNTDGA